MSMIKPDQLAKQLDEAISDAMAMTGKIGSRSEGLLKALDDPNQEEANTHVEALLRYPEALEAIGHIKNESRQFLTGFLSDVPEFEHILDKINE